MLVGDGADRARLMAAAPTSSRPGRSCSPRPGLEVLSLVRAADVGVLMTNPALAREGLSNSIMEYMALGLPVVCGDGGGNPELVRDGITGFIVPQGDPERAGREAGLPARARGSSAEPWAPPAGPGYAASSRSRRMVARMLRVYAEAMDGGR